MNRKHSLQPSRLTRYPIRQRWKPLCTLSRFRRSEKGGLDPPCKHGDRGEVYTDTPTDILPRGKCKLRSKFWWLADRAIRITYRISLRSSSLWEPRHPLLKVWIIIIDNVKVLLKFLSILKGFKKAAREYKAYTLIRFLGLSQVHKSLLGCDALRNFRWNVSSLRAKHFRGLEW